MRFGIMATAAALLLGSPAAAAPQQCDAHAFAALIDQTAQALRTLNRESERRFHERLDNLGRQQRWSEGQKADKAAAAMDDNKLEAFNDDIEELATQLDMLSATPPGQMSCARLAELKTVQEKLIAVMGQKSGFILAQLEAEGAQAPVSPYSQAAPAPAPAAPSSPVPAPSPIPAPSEASLQQAQPANAAKPPVNWPASLSQTPPPRPAPAARPVSQQAPVAPPPHPAPESRVAALNPSQTITPPPAAVPAVPSGYSAEEIREIGKGLFGTLTSEFASVVNLAFTKYGQPNAYIVGDEGGGAFLAGLRYGDGKLYTRLNGTETGPTNIYWQGPSLGADLGATGSHTLFLVYNLQDPATLYKRFPGIDGSAYVAGGFGMTVYQSGETLIVPIRTGLGLRLGASIAYLKFTERASWNPF